MSYQLHSRFIVLLIVMLSCLLILYASVVSSRIILKLDDIKTPVFNAQSIQIRLTEGHSDAEQLQIDIAEIQVRHYVWKAVRLTCTTFHFNKTVVQCQDGHLKIPGLLSSPVSLQFSSEASLLKISVNPEKKERWQLSLRWDETSWQGVLAMHQAQLRRVMAWLPDYEQLPELHNGRMNGSIQLTGNESDLRTATANLTVEALAFSDQAGLRAGENIQFTLRSDAEHIASHNRWRWHSEINWQQGEIFWQPIYMTGDNHQLRMQGIFEDDIIDFQKSDLMLTGLGAFHFSGLAGVSAQRLDKFELAADKIELSALYEQVLKPFLSDTALAEMEVSGRADLAVHLDEGVLQSVHLDLDEVNLIDSHHRFAFNRINASIPWQSSRATVADISILNGHVLFIPFGAARVPLEINQFNIFLPQLTLPVLDGALKLENFSAGHTVDGWQWKFNGELLPVSMEILTETLQIQKMHGILAGFISEVSYANQRVGVNGVLQIEVFDGSVVIHNLELIEPMGLVPHLKADIAMRHLDLELLTRTFSFGKIEGRVDAEVTDLELASWKPVHFDAQLVSSSGNYPRRISQAALKSITALGGEGAVAAIQRSFLRIFEEFRYSEIGWRCALRLNICYMGGIEDELQPRYTLVKGGGVPGITVMGYNQVVGWQELIDRLLRVTGDIEPVIQ